MHKEVHYTHCILKGSFQIFGSLELTWIWLTNYSTHIPLKACHMFMVRCYFPPAKVTISDVFLQTVALFPPISMCVELKKVTHSNSLIICHSKNTLVILLPFQHHGTCFSSSYLPLTFSTLLSVLLCPCSSYC